MLRLNRLPITGCYFFSLIGFVDIHKLCSISIDCAFDSYLVMMC